MAEQNSIIPGTKYGSLTVLGIERFEKKNGFFVATRCDCGTEKIVRFNYLMNGHTKSCGCLIGIKNKSRATHKHTERGNINRTYAIYRDMRTRCENPHYRQFYLYGGRGIKVCDRWRQGYENFLADMGERPAGMTLERIDVDGDYGLHNCRWATPAEQANNKRNSRFIEYQGRRQTVAQWARELGILDKTIYARLAQGWPPDKALTHISK